MTDSPAIQYLRMPIEAIDFPADSFDVAISSRLPLYRVVRRPVRQGEPLPLRRRAPRLFRGASGIHRAGIAGMALRRAGESSPLARGQLFFEGVRKAGFLGEEVMKYHKTLTAYVNGLLQNGFELLELVEPQPEPGLLKPIRKSCGMNSAAYDAARVGPEALTPPSAPERPRCACSWADAGRLFCPIKESDPKGSPPAPSTRTTGGSLPYFSRLLAASEGPSRRCSDAAPRPGDGAAYSQLGLLPDSVTTASLMVKPSRLPALA